MDAKIFDDLAQRINALIPPGAKALQQDLEQNLRSLLQSAFAKLDLVTREEFDAQTRVLARTRTKLAELEKQFALLLEQQNSLPGKKKPPKTGSEA